MAPRDLYFDSGGHLTEKALADLCRDAIPDELSRLEIAEHLSYCDDCTEKYTALLCGEVLLEPDPPVAEDSLRRIRQETRIVFLKRCARVGAAACLTLLVWLGGFSQLDSIELPEFQTEDRMRISHEISNSIQDFTQQVSNCIREIFDFSFERSSES